MSIEELRAKATKFQSRIRWRNVREYAAAVFVIVAFTMQAIRVSAPVPRIAFALIIAGTFYVVWHLHAWGAAEPLPSDMGSESGIAFYRRQLERQRDLLGNIWKWYLGPLIPGFALLMGWMIVTLRPDRRWRPAVVAGMAVALFLAIGWLNRRAARRLDRQIREL